MNNNITTVIDINDIDSIIANSKTQLDFDIPTNYLNYFKLLTGNKQNIENINKPFETIIPDEYKTIIHQIEPDPIKLPPGQYIIIYQPNALITHDIVKLYEKENVTISDMIIHQIDGMVKTHQCKPINVTNVIGYNLIHSDFTIKPDNENSKFQVNIGFKNMNYKPIISTENKDVYPLLNYNVLDDLKTLNTTFKATNRETKLRFLPTNINSYSTINLINNQSPFISLDLYEKCNQIINDNLTDTQSKVIEKYEMPSKVLTTNLETILSSYKDNNVTKVNAPVMILQITTDTDFTIEYNKLFELIQYDIDNDLGMQYKNDTHWNNVLKGIHTILHNLYYLDIKEIVTILCLNQSIDSEPISTKSKNEIEEIRYGPNFRTILSALVLIYKSS
jgi:viroplasmin and RNaseH domain-containing protein